MPHRVVDNVLSKKLTRRRGGAGSVQIYALNSLTFRRAAYFLLYRNPDLAFV